jgi:hypothetical protein
MHFLLFYDLTADYVERRAEYRNEHLRLAWDSSARGELILGGALTEPVDGAVLLFEAELIRQIPAIIGPTNRVETTVKNNRASPSTLGCIQKAIRACAKH